MVKHHGVPNLEKKQNSLIVNKTNTNDILKILGNPSTKSKFDDNLWIYIERKQTQSRLRNLGKLTIEANNVLVLEINNYGILEKKEFYNRDEMKKLKLAKEITGTDLKKDSFVYKLFSSMRAKINDPLNKRAEKRKEISQR